MRASAVRWFSLSDASRSLSAVSRCPTSATSSFWRRSRSAMCAFVVSAGQPLLDLRLRCRERVGERRCRPPFALCELAAPLVGDAALFLDEQRHGIGAGARQRALELRRAARRLLVDDGTQPSLRCREMGLRRIRAHECPSKQQRAGAGERRGGESAGRDAELAGMARPEREDHPAGDGRARDERRLDGRGHRRQQAERCPGEDECRKDRRRGEEHVEERRQRHWFIVRPREVLRTTRGGGPRSTAATRSRLCRDLVAVVALRP